LNVTEVPFEHVSRESRDFWDACVRTNPDLTPFHSYQWLACWAQAYGANRAAVVFEVRTALGEIDCLLPMMRWEGAVRTLSYNSSDYTGLVWSRRCSGASALANHLQVEARSSPVLLWNVRGHDPLVGALSRGVTLKLVERVGVTSVTLPLDRLRPWQQVAPISLGELRRKRGKLEKRGMTLRFAGRFDDATLTSAIALHTATWNRRGQPGSFADGRRREFLRLLGEEGPTLLCSTLSVGDRLLSYRLGPIDDRAYYDWNTGSDPDERNTSPGLVLLHGLVSRLSLSERVKRVDFLRGSEDYKRAWVTSSGWVSTYEVLGNQPPSAG
jgi:CelD/BcsL family acetyltransferase involved in cellulose biosynthesis